MDDGVRRGKRTLQGAGEKVDMVGLVLRDLLEILVKHGAEASCGKVLSRVLGQTFAVEGILEVFQSQGIVEDIDLLDVSEM